MQMDLPSTRRNFIRTGSKRVLAKIPPALKAAHRAEEYMKGMVSPGTLFEEIGFNYIGLVDGHNTLELIDILTNIRIFNREKLVVESDFSFNCMLG